MSSGADVLIASTSDHRSHGNSDNAETTKRAFDLASGHLAVVLAVVGRTQHEQTSRDNEDNETVNKLVVGNLLWPSLVKRFGADQGIIKSVVRNGFGGFFLIWLLLLFSVAGTSYFVTELNFQFALPYFAVDMLVLIVASALQIMYFAGSLEDIDNNPITDYLRQDLDALTNSMSAITPGHDARAETKRGGGGESKTRESRHRGEGSRASLLDNDYLVPLVERIDVQPSFGLGDDSSFGDRDVTASNTAGNCFKYCLSKVFKARTVESLARLHRRGASPTEIIGFVVRSSILMNASLPFTLVNIFIQMYTFDSLAVTTAFGKDP